MNPVYLETRFRYDGEAPPLPEEFVILSAYATTGETWSALQNAAADRSLEAELRARGGWLLRLIGYSPTTGHAEPSWATALPLDEACNIGRRYRQDAIYHVRGDLLSVTYCDARRALVAVGLFRDRLDPRTAAGAPAAKDPEEASRVESAVRRGGKHRQW